MIQKYQTLRGKIVNDSKNILFNIIKIAISNKIRKIATYHKISPKTVVSSFLEFVLLSIRFILPKSNY